MWKIIYIITKGNISISLRDLKKVLERLLWETGQTIERNNFFPFFYIYASTKARIINILTQNWDKEEEEDYYSWN